MSMLCLLTLCFKGHIVFELSIGGQMSNDRKTLIAYMSFS